MTTHVTSEDVDLAVAALRGGGVIAIPSDTLYALCGAASHDEAVRRVFAIKGREPDKALTLFTGSLALAEQIGVFNAMARRLAQRFWPGSLTVVVQKAAGFHSLALAGGDTVGLRMPDHPVALAVLAGLGEAVTATSANLSGCPDPVSAAEVRRQIGGDVDLIIDGGDCPVGIASTIVDCTGAEPKILRDGAVTEAAVLAALRDQDG